MALKFASPAIGFHVESGATFPATPVAGQLFMKDGILYIYDGSVWTAAGGGGGLGILPVAVYDGVLIEGTFEELQLPQDTKIKNIIGVLELLPDGNTAGADDITTVALEYTTDGGTTRSTLATINFAETDTLTNGIDIQKQTLSTTAILTADTRLRFRVTKTAVNFAGANLKIYLQ